MNNKHIRKLFILTLLLLVFNNIHAQNNIQTIGWGDAGKQSEVTNKSVPLKKGDVLIQGFSNKIDGVDISWWSHLDYAKEAIIIHANKSNKSIEWESEVVPIDIKSGDLCLVWIAGVAGTKGGKLSAPMTLYANDKKVLDFYTAGGKVWDINGNGATLSYREHMSDGSSDSYGYMYLRLPKSYYTHGEPVLLRVETKDLGLESWFMTFKSSIKSNNISASCTPGILKSNNKQVIKLNYTHFGAPEDVKIQYGENELTSLVEFGENTIDLPINKVDKTDSIAVKLIEKRDKHACMVKLQPLRNWDVRFIQITHTDIGYTRPQTDILSDHIRFIDYVLDFCDATDNYPKESQFKWTCENTWAVVEFLKIRPKSQRDRFIKRVREGRIELTAMNLNFDGMSDEQVMASSLSPLKEIKKFNLNTPKVAMQNDVNGIAWCLNEFLPEIGVKYLTMGVNNYYRVAPFDMPSYFWWTSPSGKRMLAYYGEHYMQGNALGVNGKDFKSFEKKMLEYLAKLDKQDFIYDNVGIEFLGIGGDNSAPSIYACDIVKQWNEKYESPKVSLSLFDEHMELIEKKYGNSIPAIRGAWPDWWDLGYAASARETAASRVTHSEIISNQVGFSMAKLAGSDVSNEVIDKINEVNQTILFYDEHTFGFDASVSLPFHRETMEQRAVKESYSWEAFRRNRLLRENVLGLLSEHVSRAEVPTVVVYNPLSWKRTGLARTYIDDSMFPTDKKVTIVDENGKSVPYQSHLRKHDGTYWDIFVEDVPALGYKQYFIKTEPLEGASQTLKSSVGKIETIENQWYKINIDVNKGTLTNIYDKELKQELLDESAPWEFAQLIHEELTARFPDVPVTNPKRTAPSITYAGMEEGQIWDTYKFNGHSDAGIGDGNNLYIELQVFKVAKQINLRYKLAKNLDTTPEAIYVAFPFNLPNGNISYEVPGGLSQPGVEQLIGTSNDWNTVQTFATVQNNSAQIVLGSPEIPMMQFGNINVGRFKKESLPESNNIYSWVMNNYWTTNFNADQNGEFEWNYFLTSMSGNSDNDATKFAWNNRVPFLVRTLPSGIKNSDFPTSNSFLEINPTNVVLVNMVPVKGEDAILLHLREVEGKRANIKVSSMFRPNLKVVESDVLGGEKRGNDLVIKPWESKFVKINLN